MQRRHILASLAAASTALVVAPAFAQSAMTGTRMAMSEAEMKHAKDTATVGSLSLATSRIALKKASNEMVKKFAEFETAEQETIADVLMSMEKPADDAEGALKKPSDAEVEAKLDREGMDTLAKVRDASSSAFDKEYVNVQLTGHKKLLTIQEDYLKIGKNREHLSVAKLARGVVKEHISHLEDLHSKLG